MALAGAVGIVRHDIAQRREDFQADARVAYRLLSQRCAEHDAILATLALAEPSFTPAAFEDAAQRLRALYPQLVAVLRRDPGTSWLRDELAVAEARSRAVASAHRHAVVATVDAASASYILVLAGERAGLALRIALGPMMAFEAWPLQRAGAVRAVLLAGPHAMVLNPGPDARALPAGLTAGFTFAKALPGPSQPFELQVQRRTGPAEWPWALLLGWATGTGLLVALVAAWWHGRQDRLRNAELMRLSQVTRLNMLGELAGGMAHELNQPLTAILASTQTAQRVLGSGNEADDDEDLDTARRALALAAGQARRAADVLARLRRLVEQPHAAQARTAVPMNAVAARLLDLLAPELRRRDVRVQVLGEAPPMLADPVALEQILHNLLTNAMQALDGAGPRDKLILLRIDTQADRGRLRVEDNGPGIPAEALPRIFEPFFTLRPGGLGLGLSLCETLAQAMEGRLSAANAPSGGALFTLTLPLAATTTAR
jgi:signal transduction histidine kinase